MAARSFCSLTVVCGTRGTRGTRGLYASRMACLTSASAYTSTLAPLRETDTADICRFTVAGLTYDLSLITVDRGIGELPPFGIHIFLLFTFDFLLSTIPQIDISPVPQTAGCFRSLERERGRMKVSHDYGWPASW
jgi:hypothetical protein